MELADEYTFPAVEGLRTRLTGLTTTVNSTAIIFAANANATSIITYNIFYMSCSRKSTSSVAVPHRKLKYSTCVVVQDALSYLCRLTKIMLR